MNTARLVVEIVGLVLASVSLVVKVLINGLVGMEVGGPPAFNFTGQSPPNFTGPVFTAAAGPELNSSGPPFPFPAEMFGNPTEVCEHTH